MNPDPLAEIQRQFEAINAELAALSECRAVGDCPATREGELLEALDRLEYEAALIQYPRFRQP